MVTSVLCMPKAVAARDLTAPSAIHHTRTHPPEGQTCRICVQHPSCLLGTAASDLTRIGAIIGAANAAAATRTTSLLAAAEDEVSTAIAALFGAHAR